MPGNWARIGSKVRAPCVARAALWGFTVPRMRGEAERDELTDGSRHQGANVGELIGLLINGWASERFGYRWTVIGSLMLINAWTALFFTAQNAQTLLAAEILCGIVGNLRPPLERP